MFSKIYLKTFLHNGRLPLKLIIRVIIQINYKTTTNINYKKTKLITIKKIINKIKEINRKKSP